MRCPRNRRLRIDPGLSSMLGRPGVRGVRRTSAGGGNPARGCAGLQSAKSAGGRENAPPKRQRASAGPPGFRHASHGVLHAMELAALPRQSSEHRLPGGLEPAVVIADQELHTPHAAVDEALEEGSPVRLGLGELNTPAGEAPLAVGADPDGPPLQLGPPVGARPRLATLDSGWHAPAIYRNYVALTRSLDRVCLFALGAKAVDRFRGQGGDLPTCFGCEGGVLAKTGAGQQITPLGPPASCRWPWPSSGPSCRPTRSGSLCRLAEQLSKTKMRAMANAPHGRAANHTHLPDSDDS